MPQRKSNGKIVHVYFTDTGQLLYEKNRKVCGLAKRCGTFQGDVVCTKTLYNYVDLGLIGVKNIDLPMKVRLNTKKTRNRKNKRILGLSIDERPAEINERQEFGHWEIDTVIGKKTKDQALLTLTERKTRKELILRVTAKDSLSISEAMANLKATYGDQFSKVFKTITADNGSEFSELGIAVENEKTDVYFTHPYTSCERGTNERHNGLIRRFIPKGKPISSVADETISYAENWCNHLPRKILDYRTPEEYFQEELAGLAS